jgi:hypothetical protein
MKELTSSHQDEVWHQRKFTQDAHIPPPHLKFALPGNKTQVCEDQASFCKYSFTKTYQDATTDVAHMFLGIIYSSFFSIST